jgi:hypothetical protein
MRAVQPPAWGGVVDECGGAGVDEDVVDVKLTGVRVRELIEPLGFDGSKTIVDDYLREVRPVFSLTLDEEPRRLRWRDILGDLAELVGHELIAGAEAGVIEDFWSTRRRTSTACCRSTRSPCATLAPTASSGGCA